MPHASHPAVAPHWLTGQTIHPGLRLALGLERGDGWRAIDPMAPRFALCLIEAGSALVELDGGATLLTAPAVLLCDERTRPRALQAQRLQCRTVYFHPTTVNAEFDLATLRAGDPGFSDSTRRDLYLLAPFLAGVTALALAPSSETRVRDGLCRLEAEASEQGEWNWPCRTRSFLIETLFALRLLAEQRTPTLAGEPSRLDQALLLVHERFATSFTLDELARWVGSNRTSINRHFRARVGQSVRAYVIALRLEMATRLLRETLLPIAEIVGYDNQSHFARAYRDAYCWLR